MFLVAFASQNLLLTNEDRRYFANFGFGLPILSHFGTPVASFVCWKKILEEKKRQKARSLCKEAETRKEKEKRKKILEEKKGSRSRSGPPR